MTLAIILLLCVSIIVLGAVATKPVGWVAVALGTLALLLAVLSAAKVQL